MNLLKIVAKIEANYDVVPYIQIGTILDFGEVQSNTSERENCTLYTYNQLQEPIFSRFRNMYVQIHAHRNVNRLTSLLRNYTKSELFHLEYLMTSHHPLKRSTVDSSVTSMKIPDTGAKVRAEQDIWIEDN